MHEDEDLGRTILRMRTWEKVVWWDRWTLVENRRAWKAGIHRLVPYYLKTTEVK